MGELFLGTHSRLEAEAIGNFLRRMYYLNKPEIRCFGIRGTSTYAKETVGIMSVLDWNQTIIDILLAINKVKYTLNDVTESLTDGEEREVGPFVIKRSHSNVYAVTFTFDKSRVSTMDFAPIFNVSDDYTIYTSMADGDGPDTQHGPFTLVMFFVYGTGNYTEDYLRERISEYGDVFTLPVSCVNNGKMMFKTTGTDEESILTLHWDDECGDVQQILSDVLQSLQLQVNN